MFDPTTTAPLCIFTVLLLHTTGVIICSTIPPDVNPTPPFEFPSDGVYIKSLQDEPNINLTKPLILYFGNKDEITTDGPASRLQEINRQLRSNDLLPLQHINVIAKISENYTENKYYNSRIEENWSSISLTLIALTIMAAIVLTCSALCIKKVQNLNISNRQLLIEDCEESVMSDLIQVQHV